MEGFFFLNLPSLKTPVKSSAPVKFITVRSTAFEAAPADGGNATCVLFAQDAALEAQLPERVAPVLVAVQRALGATHVLAGACAFARSVVPRAAALCDVSPVSEISAVLGDDTFLRPTYAGNAIAKVKSSAPVKFITVRSTAFEAAPADGGNATLEKAPDFSPPSPDVIELSAFLGQELSKSERPELGGAKIVISGGRGLKSGDNFSLLCGTLIFYPIFF
ncbi:hypothetical protein niasHT_003238 [Heterodera trifolii]|uniref:Electron transfer flavoprotein alpha/beta-subunit N-terminal domain-containing protein n=1 Tax=Heterodera trifolii TaxID=157864 RepID=A0ABD2MAJ7_9BILA